MGFLTDMISANSSLDSFHIWLAQMFTDMAFTVRPPVSSKMPTRSLFYCYMMPTLNGVSTVWRNLGGSTKTLTMTEAAHLKLPLHGVFRPRMTLCFFLRDFINFVKVIYASYKKIKQCKTLQNKIQKFYNLEITMNIILQNLCVCTHIHPGRDSDEKGHIIRIIHCYLNSTEETEAEAKWRNY